MESHLLQMRGLKHQGGPCPLREQESHLLQMRGLKPSICRWVPVSWCRIFYRCVD